MKYIELAILRVLSDCQPNMLREHRLFAAVLVECNHGITHGDYVRARTALETAEGGAQIFGTNPGDGARWKITAEGITRLAQA